MDFAKYASLISTQALYFARSDCFDDDFEGAKGLRSRKKKWDQFYLDFFKQAIRALPEGAGSARSDTEVEEEAVRLLAQMDQGGEDHRKRVFVNCWHENEQESEAMWRLYSSYIDNAVAIRTSTAALHRCLGRNPSMNIGRVRYVDFSKEFSGPNNAFWRKRTSFRHEREVRAIIMDHEDRGLGMPMKCDLSILLEDVYISPFAPRWFRAVVDDLNAKYGITATVKASELNEDPFY